jgi:hypothetical protein
MTKLSSLVNPGNYIRYGSSEKPGGLPWGGANCRAIVVAASTFEATPLPDIPETNSPDGNVYLIRYFRTYPRKLIPYKVDDALYWVDRDGNPWSIHSKDSPDHHLNIMTSSDLSGLIKDHNLPTASQGSLKEYRKAGARIDFTEPFIAD